MTETRPAQDRVLIFDTTLRDGEQSPGATMTLEEKLQIAALLDAMGVDIIEAGFPIASEGDFEAVSQIARLAESAVICGLARANYADIDRCWEAVRHARRPRIHTFIGTSPLHREFQVRLDKEAMAEKIHDTVTRARNLCDNVQWSPMDATRTEPDYLARVCEIAIKAGATTINIPDTVGYTAPRESAAIIRDLLERVPGMDAIVIATHCHNDLGMATANALAAVEAGARQIECTINGLGERAGNTSLEEVVMAMRVRNDILPYRTGIDTTKIMQASRLVATVSGFPVQFNKAIVGKNAFAHESGIHQDGMLKHAGTFEIMRPEDVGLNATSLVMGKHSGRAALRAKLEELGYRLGDNQLADVFVRFKELADTQEGGLRRRPRRADAGHRHPCRQRPHQGEAPQGGLRHRQPAHRRAGAADRRGRACRARHRRRPGGRGLQGGGDAGGPHRAAGALPGARGHRGHRRAGDGQRAAGGGRQDRHRPVGGHRHRGRLDQGLRQRAQQAPGAAAEDRAGGGERLTGGGARTRVPPAQRIPHRSACLDTGDGGEPVAGSVGSRNATCSMSRVSTPIEARCWLQAPATISACSSVRSGADTAR